MNIQTALQAVLEKQDLSRQEMRDVMRSIMSGESSSAQIAGFLIALRCKGETVEEITAAAEVMRELASKVNIQGEHIIDTCGTGGDGANTFNISTTCAFVVAAAGGAVAKHGNRSVSSRSGSADVLEAAGVNLNLSADQVAQCVNSIGVGFLFAQKHHGAMKHVGGPRKEMGVRTLFNLLGPLANPAGAPNQLIGVFDKQWVEPVAHVLKALGSEHVLVVHADDGLDEISIASETTVAELNKGEITTYRISPEQFGLQRANLADLAVTDVEHSLAVVMSALNNQPGPARDIVVLNSGAAIYAAGLVDSLAAGIAKAQEVLASGAAKEKLDALVNFH
ncbi:anthranilate phosphoribosyltransferase [Bathymodiolus platifrons methanotrophic gill symbiont]|uniref:anthranilate phosphoribosyltransferase n=1 Tax=Bathymodiolus platifrons methanotrophic gill symbiont TaxID=113268 RepID=UPI000B422F7A|nr:anthranilate phosphoribosyltransferase [Bathymodiolus platifrons methanotrophic gill symbiont]MCK5869610.1 anthranilate phosphoribosyltransferase [Methyloprofundus sp.]TXK97843.1 anthranilate phosphoribosyltransferase [Methylococcaceae bacterium CS4]TXL00365.1 anthranilate phosphoribosyltransferase [Methylococcaceae bacterium CS5]TXL07492.1 anthranilate phosphoribosyltransferase [Methylococcaceae bacterium CS3]TXL08089.1 anthranilate phosphoribosyltransferase [Methylococcaceae bacterium CS1